MFQRKSHNVAKNSCDVMRMRKKISYKTKKIIVVISQVKSSNVIELKL